MKLTEYIKQNGDVFCAELFNVKPRTTASWRRGERHPRPEQANLIVNKTNGEVTMSGIYNLEH